MATFELGSDTAKGGFVNEKTICKKFNNWKKDNEAKQWLQIMGYDIKQIDSIEAVHIPTRLKKTDIVRFGLREDFEELMRFKKADAQVRVTIVISNIVKIENLSLKMVTIKKDKPTSGFNQIDKRWVDSYKQIWNFDNDIAYGLKLYTGGIKPPKEIAATQKLRDKRRVYLNEMPDRLRNKIIDFFKANKILIVCDILKGRGGLSADWILVTRYEEDNDTTTWMLTDINTAMNFFGAGDIYITKKGVLHIGRITVQRKGGDAGRPTSNMLQFKIKPCNLFNLK
ncbi:MAG: type II restriction endonuclease [Nitrospirota bacterium]